MDRIILQKNQIQELVFQNSYQVEKNREFLARDIGGQCEENVKPSESEGKKASPALTFPGADAGELALLLAASNVFGFEADLEKSLVGLVKLIGGEKNFNFDFESSLHLQQILLDPQSYNLEKEQTDKLFKLLKIPINKPSDRNIIQTEGALLQIEGDYGVLPNFFLKTQAGETRVSAFVFHESLANKRHKVWAEKLVEGGGVKLYPGCDAEYLYEVLSDMTDDHLFETLRRVGKELPIYLVKFDNNGAFSIEDMGKI